MKSIFDELNDAARSAIEISYGKKLDPILNLVLVIYKSILQCLYLKN